MFRREAQSPASPGPRARPNPRERPRSCSCGSCSFSCGVPATDVGGREMFCVQGLKKHSLACLFMVVVGGGRRRVTCSVLADAGGG